MVTGRRGQVIPAGQACLRFPSELTSHHGGGGEEASVRTMIHSDLTVPVRADSNKKRCRVAEGHVTELLGEYRQNVCKQFLFACRCHNLVAGGILEPNLALTLLLGDVWANL